MLFYARVRPARMPLKAKDHEEIHRNPPDISKIVRFTDVIVPLLRLLQRIPPIRRWLANSIGGMQQALVRCFQAEDYEKAAKIAIYALKKLRHKTSLLFLFSPHHHWWEFMKFAVQSLERCESKEMRDEVIGLAKDGIEPFEGHDVAYSFDRFSRWRYEEKDYDTAVNFAEIASKADETWADSDLLLGWYNLALDRGDPVPHLRRAIKKDHRILFRISQDPLFSRYPHIIGQLKNLAIEHGIVVCSTEPDDQK